MTDRITVLEDALRAVRRTHLIVDGDCWYSCPLARHLNEADSACCDSAQPNECNCGADWANAIIDKALGVA